MAKRNVITTDEKRYLLPSEIRPGKLQANPKLHKQNVLFRTIVNGRNHPTERLAEFVEKQLSENVKSIPSYIKDTTDFLKKLSLIDQPLPIIILVKKRNVTSVYIYIYIF